MATRFSFSENGSHDRHFSIGRTGLHGSFNDECKPPGFIRGDFDGADRTPGGSRKDDRQAILMRQAWAKAKSPGKQILMSGLMMWMSGSTMSIFTLMMMTMVMINPMTALFGVQAAFKQYESPENGRALWLPKIAYMALNLVCVGIGIWKLDKLGLLPTGQHIPPTVAAPNYMEYSIGIMS